MLTPLPKNPAYSPDDDVSNNNNNKRFIEDKWYRPTHIVSITIRLVERRNLGLDPIIHRLQTNRNWISTINYY